MAFDWDDLRRELDRWAAAGRAAKFWWRDDDAIEPSPALDRLLDLTAAFRIEIGLAVIPARAVESLATALAGRPYVAVFQHGYRHLNHAPAGELAVECGGARPVEEVLRDLRAGFRDMTRLFPEKFEPILAAPWNRIEPRVLLRLAEAGFWGASAYGPRARMAGADGLVVANAHIDPLNWKERRFAGRDKALSGIVGELEARRTGATEPEEPLGLLTHHLDHDSAAWEFLDELLKVTTAHSAAHWLGAREAFGLGPAAGAARAGARR